MTSEELATRDDIKRGWSPRERLRRALTGHRSSERLARLVGASVSQGRTAIGGRSHLRRLPMPASDPSTSPGLRSKKARDIEAGDVLTREDNREVRRPVSRTRPLPFGFVRIWTEDGSEFDLRGDDSVYVEFREGTE
jgi:hypothetical protein